MDIPTDIPKRINPEIQDPISKSVVYTFQNKDAHHDNEGNILYKFPYSKDTYWTNFKYSCYNNTKDNYEQLEIGIKLVTSDNYDYVIQMRHKRQDKVWYDIEWPFPSVYTFGSIAGLYFKVKPLSDNSKYTLNISLLGFMDLFPQVDNYLLLSSLDTYQFVFSKWDREDVLGEQGAIHNVENYDYIRDIINKACGIRLIKRY